MELLNTLNICTYCRENVSPDIRIVVPEFSLNIKLSSIDGYVVRCVGFNSMKLGVFMELICVCDTGPCRMMGRPLLPSGTQTEAIFAIS